ncbi:type II secretion system protein GspC [Nannocystaceae bacterium ST9]
MEALFKKYFWLVKLLGVAVIVGFAASAVANSVISRQALAPAGEGGEIDKDKDDEGETEGDPDDEDPSMSQAKVLDKLSNGAANTARQRKERMVESVVAGSIFCPTCAPAPAPVSPTASLPGTAGAMLSGTAPPRPGEVPSKLPLSLLATMESDDPEYSMATILHTDSKALGAYSPKDQLRPGVTVERIERGKVVFRNGGQVEYILMGAQPPPPAPTAPTAPVEEEKPANDREIEGAAEAISCDEEMTNCTVDKAFVEKLMANPAQLAKQARIVPAVADGETKGYKFYGIRPGSLPKLLGLKNGDLLTSVNGHELESLDQAMDLYNKLRRASHLSVTVERKGKLIQKEIDIK